ncbi:hypothetical protein MRX96_040521 [Rhipicephalus microplus]
MADIATPEVTENIVSRKAEPAWMEVMACQTLLTEERNPWKLTGALLRDHLKADEFMEERGHNTMFVEASREGSERQGNRGDLHSERLLHTPGATSGRLVGKQRGA